MLEEFCLELPDIYISNVKNAPLPNPKPYLDRANKQCPYCGKKLPKILGSKRRLEFLRSPEAFTGSDSALTGL
jgi:hypothetical protein